MVWVRKTLYQSVFRSLFPNNSPTSIVNGIKIDNKKKEIEGYIESDYGLDDYCHIFRLSPEQLKGKVILDVGCGRRERFSKEAGKHGAIVYSITPAYGESGFPGWQARRRASKKFLFFEDPAWQHRSIAARVQQLPFKDQGFDLVLSNFTFTIYVKDTKEKFLSVVEMTRVVKPQGLVMLFPFNSPDMTLENYTIEGNLGRETIKWLQENEWGLYYDEGPYAPIVIGRFDNYPLWSEVEKKIKKL